MLRSHCCLFRNRKKRLKNLQVGFSPLPLKATVIEDSPALCATSIIIDCQPVEAPKMETSPAFYATSIIIDYQPKFRESETPMIGLVENETKLDCLPEIRYGKGSFSISKKSNSSLSKWHLSKIAPTDPATPSVLPPPPPFASTPSPSAPVHSGGRRFTFKSG